MPSESLVAKLLDPDEKVRAAVCNVYSQLDYETALHHVSETQLRAVAGRGVDRKVYHLIILALDLIVTYSSSNTSALRP